MYGINCAVSILEGPNLSETRKRELQLARRMALAINVILNTKDLEVRIESAKDLVREVKHVYPETGEL
jgi:hypothetical protein